MSKTSKVIVAVIFCIIVLGVVIFGMTPDGREIWNNWFHAVQKADDATNYATKKHVEDSCRAMISSYTSDCLTYQQYNGSESSEKQSWADQARMRVNKTAATYNEYVLKNSYVWEGNVPIDIKSELPYIE